MEAMTTDTANADIRAVFFDIDGTLTSFTTHTVPDSTIEAIHRLQAAGVKVLICTGRAPSQMHVVLDTMPVTFDGVVAFNGQYCFDDTGFFASQALDTADIEVILDWLDRHPDVVCNFGEKDYVYFNQSNDLLRATWSKLGKTAPTRYFEDPRTRALDHETFQISPFVGPELEAELVGLCSNVRGVRWHPDFTDLIPADGGKPRGIQRFMAHYGITPEAVTLWGTGKPLREFLWSEEMADASVHVLLNVDFKDTYAPGERDIRNCHINVGTGKELTIREVAEKIMAEIGFKGELRWDASKPDGTMRKLTDVTKLHRLGWHHTVEIDEGVHRLYEWYLKGICINHQGH